MNDDSGALRDLDVPHARSYTSPARRSTADDAPSELYSTRPPGSPATAGEPGGQTSVQLAGLAPAAQYARAVQSHSAMRRDIASSSMGSIVTPIMATAGRGRASVTRARASLAPTGAASVALAAGVLVPLRSPAEEASMPEIPALTSAASSSPTGELPTGGRRRDQEEADIGPASPRVHKRARVGEDDAAPQDLRAVMEAEVERTDTLRRRHRSDFLGFYNDAPTLDMLTDIEVFMFTQRERWFELGRLEAWAQYERELSQSGIPHDQSAVLEEIHAANRTLTEKNSLLSEKLDALSKDLNGLEDRFDEYARMLETEKRDNRRLRERLGQSERELELLRALRSTTTSQPSLPDHDTHVRSVGMRSGGTIFNYTAADDLDFFDPEAAPYDQQRFVETSMALDQRLSQRRHNVLKGLAEPAYTIPPHYIWTTQQYNLPVPLGRFGQPYWSGSAWEDFNPMRLYQNLDDGKVERGDALWIRLAEDAVKLPFEFRSNAQRIIVSEAHRFKPNGSSRFILPLAGQVPEVDVWHQCANNAIYMPLAIRRQYSYNKSTRTLYREWDAADLGIYLILRACGPENKSRKDKKKQPSQQPTEPTKWSSWSDQVRRAVLWADAQRDSSREPLGGTGMPDDEDAYSTPRRYSGSGEPDDVFHHLTRHGFSRDRMMRSGDVYQYLERAERLEKRLRELKEQVAADNACTDHNVLLALAKCRMELEDDSVPSSRPVVRCRVRSTDPVAAEHLKRLLAEM